MSEQHVGAVGELVCRTDSRRGRIRAARLNGIDAVEVADDGVTLTVTFLGKAPHGLCPENVRIDGGRRITGIEALEVSVEREEDPELDDRLHVVLDRAGDTSATVSRSSPPTRTAGRAPSRTRASTSDISVRSSVSRPIARAPSTASRRRAPTARTPSGPPRSPTTPRGTTTRYGSWPWTGCG